MRLPLFAALACAAMSTSAFAQVAIDQQAVAPQSVAPAMASIAQRAVVRLPANANILLALNSGLNTKTHKLGDRFSMTVAQDVLSGGHVVIPRGTRAVGQVTRANGNGSFGKSGKMEVSFRYLDLGGKQVPLQGSFFQEGRGNTAATVGAVLAAGVIGGLVVKGHSASIPEGREFTATTREDIPFVSQGAPGTPALLQANYNPSPVSLQVETDKERKKREKQEKREAERAAKNRR